jgi:hypothetical protein
VLSTAGTAELIPAGTLLFIATISDFRCIALRLLLLLLLLLFVSLVGY